MKSFEQLAQVAYAAYCQSARDQKTNNSRLWLHPQPCWEALNPEMHTCWTAAVQAVVEEIKHIQ